jgi:hypothetical protein
VKDTRPLLAFIWLDKFWQNTFNLYVKQLFYVKQDKTLKISSELFRAPIEGIFDLIPGFAARFASPESVLLNQSPFQNQSKGGQTVLPVLSWSIMECPIVSFCIQSAARRGLFGLG